MQTWPATAREQVSGGAIITWTATAVAVMLAAIVGVAQGFSLSWGYSALQGMLLLIICPLGFALYGLRRPAFSVLVVPMHAFAQFSAFNMAILMLQFPLASFNFPAVDPQLAAIDKALGGDWPSHFAWLTSAPIITSTMTGIYQALLLQVPIVCAIVGTLDPKRLQIFILSNTIGLGTILAIATFFPAESALGYWGTPGFRSDPLEQFHAVRNGTLRVLDPNVLTGILTFPSYHTLLAILVVLAFRGLPRVFPVVVAFQLAIVLATRGVGGHYFADIAAGAAIAFLANLAARILLRGCMRHADLTRTLIPAASRVILGNRVPRCAEDSGRERAG